VRVERLEERDRVGDVDEHRQAEIARERQGAHHARVVGQHQGAGGVPDLQPEVLPHLHARRAAGRAVAEPVGEQPLPVVRREQGPVELAERAEPRGVGPVVPVEVRLQLVAVHAVEVHDRGDAVLVHERQQRVDVGGGPAGAGEPAAEVVVHVDARHGAAGDVGAPGHEGAARLPVREAQVGERVRVVGAVPGGDGHGRLHRVRSARVSVSCTLLGSARSSEQYGGHPDPTQSCAGEQPESEHHP